MTFFACGKFNRLLGWTLLIAGMAAMSGLDPWIFGQQEATELLGSSRMQFRHAQGVILAMALLCQYLETQIRPLPVYIDHGQNNAETSVLHRN